MSAPIYLDHNAITPLLREAQWGVAMGSGSQWGHVHIAHLSHARDANRGVRSC
jgi:hypothetical protein